MSQFEILAKELQAVLPDIEIKLNEPMKNHTSFRIGGPCDLVVIPHSADELASCLSFFSGKGIRPLVFGAGSNVLVPDDGIRGAAIITRGALGRIYLKDETTIVAESGVTLAQLALFAVEEDLTGLEFAQGIPGTVGGGIYMNAGAYGGELKDAAVRTRIIHMDGTAEDIVGEAQGFRYRNSAFQTMDAVIAEAEFSLKKGNRAEIRAAMQDFAARRCSKQPLELPSAGSTFKRPEGYFAAALIEQAGLKGFRVGDAAVSEKHAGFVVNLGNATAEDVLGVIRGVQERVFEHAGVMLEPEVRLIRG